MNFRMLLLLCGLISGNAHTCLAEQPTAAPLVRGTRPNILFIAVDDLNHWVRHLGRNAQAKTPHLDRLAAMGVTFSNAHCAAPVCNPSRAAILSGLRPGSSGVYDNNIPFVRGVNAGQSLVTQFRQASYETLGMGKIWHTVDLDLNRSGQRRAAGNLRKKLRQIYWTIAVSKGFSLVC
jgi:arylsulfatase A-like enzyme